MEPPRDGNGDDSDVDRDIENGRSKGGPPPPPPPGPASHPPSSSKAAASPMKLKATDHVKFEDLRSTRAGENLYYGKKAAWRGPISHTKGDWKAYSPGAHSAAKSTPPATLKVVTYNVLFAEECMGDRRVATELVLLQEANADIITIVEATPGFLNPLLASKWVQQSYHISDGKDARTLSHCSCLILSKFPFEELLIHELPSRRNRHALIGIFSVGGHRLAVTCVHLESPPRDRELRIAQLDVIFRVLASLRADSLMVAGDFNFGDDTHETTHIASKYPQWQDAWKVVKPPTDRGITFSVTQNELTVAMFPGEIDKRLDRVLYHSAHLQPTDAALIGTEPVKDEHGKKVMCKPMFGLWPSDHFGVQVSFAIVGGGGSEAGKDHHEEKCVCS